MANSSIVTTVASCPDPVSLDRGGDLLPDCELAWDETAISDEWDDFVQCHSDGHHEQTSRWGQSRSLLGWTVSRMLLRQRHQIVAGMQLQTRPLRRLSRWGYVTYGPCIDSRHSALAPTLLAGLLQRARAQRLAFVVVGLPYTAHWLTPHLTAAGFLPKPALLPPTFMEATTLIDLSPTPEQLLAAMRRSTRRNARHAGNKGIRLVESDERGLGTFYSLMEQLCARRGTSPNPARLDFFVQLWRQFQPKGWIRLFHAMLGDEPVSAALAFTFRDSFRVWKVGWSGAHANLKPNEGMWWELIQYARRNGFRHFDFVELDPVLARAVLAGTSLENVPENVTTFKLGFGGKIVMLPGAYYYVVSPGLRVLFRCGLGRLLQSRRLIRFLRAQTR